MPSPPSKKIMLNKVKLSKMPAKLERCVRKVKAQNSKSGKKVNPWAVCQKSTGLKVHSSNKKRK